DVDVPVAGEIAGCAQESVALGKDVEQALADLRLAFGLLAPVLMAVAVAVPAALAPVAPVVVVAAVPVVVAVIAVVAIVGVVAGGAIVAPALAVAVLPGRSTV